MEEGIQCRMQNTQGGWVRFMEFTHTVFCTGIIALLAVPNELV